MISTSEINRIKQQVAIADLLASRGIQPVSQTGGELAYRSPLRNDSSPSFYVNQQKNVFKDMVVEEHRGDIIRLVELLDGLSFSAALCALQTFVGQPDHPRFFLSGSSLKEPNSAERIREVKLLQNPALLRYVESRGISVANARAYLREVHYSHKSRYLYAVGFPNDRDGYALRNGVGCKRNIGHSAISTLVGSTVSSPVANLFEGTFDFLSALEYFSQQVPTYPTYVLNSVSNLNQLISHLGSYRRINVYFDLDAAGQKAYETLLTRGLPVRDCSGIYQGYNDFNDFLTSRPRS